MFGKVARLENTNVLRKLVFEDNSCNFKQISERGRGRPRKIWHEEIGKVLKKMFNNDEERDEYIVNAKPWKRRIWHCTEICHDAFKN